VFEVFIGYAIALYAKTPNKGFGYLVLVVWCVPSRRRSSRLVLADEQRLRRGPAWFGGHTAAWSLLASYILHLFASTGRSVTLLAACSNAFGLIPVLYFCILIPLVVIGGNAYSDMIGQYRIALELLDTASASWSPGEQVNIVSLSPALPLFERLVNFYSKFQSFFRAVFIFYAVTAVGLVVVRPCVLSPPSSAPDVARAPAGPRRRRLALPHVAAPHLQRDEAPDGVDLGADLFCAPTSTTPSRSHAPSASSLPHSPSCGPRSQALCCSQSLLCTIISLSFLGTVFTVVAILAAYDPRGLVSSSLRAQVLILLPLYAFLVFGLACAVLLVLSARDATPDDSTAGTISHSRSGRARSAAQGPLGSGSGATGSKLSERGRLGGAGESVDGAGQHSSIQLVQVRSEDESFVAQTWSRGGRRRGDNAQGAFGGVSVAVDIDVVVDGEDDVEDEKGDVRREDQRGAV